MFCFLRTPIIFYQDNDVGLTLQVEANPLICDCRDYDIISKLRLFTRSKWLAQLTCDLPSRLYGDSV